MFHNFRSYGRRVAFVPLLMAGTLLAGCSSDEGAVGFGFGEDEAVQQNDLRSTIPYEVELTGIDPQEEQLIARRTIDRKSEWGQYRTAFAVAPDRVTCRSSTPGRR